ncbi:MAG: hypothetical protein AAGG75_18830 [Bacteroidota bacterium]
MEVHIQRLNAARLPDLFYLAQQLGHPSPHFQDLEQRYAAPQVVPNYLGYLAYDQQQPVAFCGAIAQQLDTPEGSLQAAQFKDLLVVKKWEEGRLLKRLARRVELLCLSHALTIHYAIADKAVQLWLKEQMGWQYLPGWESSSEEVYMGISFDAAIQPEQFIFALNSMS